ncbi:hypothetical protein [Streptomyces sp. NPDC059783]|uniref:hypothetical protein n=1 Tax=Streptomyces sp. NPDC059783 TaxID=3346944 RepID=UPI003655BF85
MTRQTTTRTRSSVTGCAVLALITAVLAAVAVCVAAAIAVPAFFDRPDVPPEERLAKKTGLTEYRLRTAVRDGTLTDPEIAYAAGGRWSVERAPSTIRVAVRYSPEEACYAYEVKQPLIDATAVRKHRLDRCPAVPHEPT